MMRKKNIFFLLPFLIFILAATSLPTVRVGVYHNPPLSFVENDQPGGFFVEVLDRIAEEEGWQLEYYLCEWDRCLQALEKGEIDMLGPIAYSEERSKRFDYSSETMLTNWGQVYVQSGETDISILDLQDKPIAMLEGDIHADTLFSITEKFDIEVEPVYFSNYDDILVAIEEKQVYGGVLNHIYAMQHTPAYDVEETGIMFNPIEVRFAVLKGRNAELLAKLDAQIVAMKADDNSIYHQAMNSWLQPEFNQLEEVDSWIWWSMGGVLLVVVLLLGINRFLHAEVQNRTEDARRSREELALIIDRIPEMIAFVDAEQRYLYVDEGYARWYGFEKEDVVGKYVEEVLPPKNYAKVRPNLLKMITTGEELHYSHQVVRHDGMKANLAISYIPKKDKNGKVEAFFATLRDITQEKQTEIALAESESKYRQLVDNASIGIFIVQDEKICFLNQAVLTLFGYSSSDDMLDRPMSDFVAPQDSERVKAELNSVILGTGSGLQSIFKALRKGGNVFDAEIVRQLIQYNGEPAVQVMLIDVSDQVRAEARFRRLSEASHEAIFISERGICLEQNNAAERMFGYSLEEAIGRMGTEWVAYEDRELVMHHMLAGFEEPYRVTALHKDGTTFPVEIVGRMMEYEGRKVRVTALRDISVQLKAEENLRESEERYRSIIQKNHAVMFLIDPSTGDIVDANAAASEFYGWTQEELQGKTISEINLLSDAEIYVEMQHAKTTERNQFFFKHRLANGEIRDVEVYSTPMSVYGRDLLHSIVHDISDRVKAEKELLDSKERFETIIAKMHIPIGVIDIEGKPDSYNERFTEVFGYKSDEVVDWWETIYPDPEYRAAVKKDWEEAVKRAKESDSQFETRVWDIVRKDGQKRTVEFDIVLLDGFSIVVMNDITEQQQASRELKDREQKLREAQQIGKIGHWELDLQSNELTWSEQVCRIFNIDLPNLTTSYEVFLNGIHPEDREYVNESYSRSLENKTPYDITHRLLLDGGEVRYVQERCKTEYDQQGNPLRSLGTTQDITEEVHSKQVMNLRAELAEYSLNHSLSELLRKTLDEAEEFTNSKIGFYHFVDEDQNNVSLQQWSSRTVKDYCEVPDDLGRHYSIDKAGVWVECIKTKAPIIHNDYDALENAKGLPEGHAALRRELTVPVIRGDKVLAILGLGNKPTEYTQQDVEIVSKIADFCWEIAESKQIEEALSESESLLHATQKLAGLGSYRFYIYSEEWTSNNVLDEIFGIDENYKRSIEGWLGIIHPEDQPMMKTYLFENVLGKETPFDKRYRIVQQNTQEVRWVHGLGKLEYDNEGHLVSMVGTIQDITARTLVEKELEISEERLRTLINATPDIICFKDGQGRWLTANDAELKLFELTNVDYVGKKDSELAEYGGFHRKTFSAFEDSDETAWLAGGLSRANQVVPTPDDGDKVYDVIKVPLFKEDGTREALVILGRDITQQVAFQNELKHHVRQLEIVNAIGTALTTSLALDELLKTILQQVVQVVNCDSASIFLVEDDDKLRIVNAVGAAEIFINRTFELSETLMKKIAPDQKIHISDDLLDDLDYKYWDGGATIRAWMGLPLYARGNLIGYLTFDNAQPRSFTASDASLAIAFATQVAQALNNAQLHERVIADANDLEKHIQKRTEELQRFVDLTAGREVRMIELKSIIRELRRQLVLTGQVPVVGDEFDVE